MTDKGIKLEVVELTEDIDLDKFFSKIDQMIAWRDRIRSIRVGIDVEGVKFSINGGNWSPPMGEHSA